MKAFLISDNVDTAVGLKFAGIQSVVLHMREDILEKVNELKKNKEIGIIILTEKIAELIEDRVREIKLSKEIPLIVEIPDRHGTIKGQDSILKYVKESVGIKI
jgi:V/A-type H+/Na+-transporting ATPase subunit F